MKFRPQMIKRKVLKVRIIEIDFDNEKLVIEFNNETMELNELWINTHGCHFVGTHSKKLSLTIPQWNLLHDTYMKLFDLEWDKAWQLSNADCTDSFRAVKIENGGI